MRTWSGSGFVITERPSLYHLLPAQSSPDGQFDGRVGRAIRPVKDQWFSRKQRRLGHESRLGSSIDLSGMDQKRMAEIDRSGRASGQHFIAISGLAVVQLTWAQARLTDRRKHPRNLQM